VPETAHTSAQLVAASAALRSLVGGPPRSGRVLGVGSAAAYLQAGGDLVALEASDALRLPCAVVVPQPAATGPFAALRPGDPVRVGADRVVAGRCTFAVVRWWTPRRPRRVQQYDAARGIELSQLLPPLADRLAAPLTDLTTALRTGTDPTPCLRRLVGLGDGLTPQGDDVLAGMLVALRAQPRHRATVQRLGAIIGAIAPGRTTLISAALLGYAARGLAAPRLLGVVDALHRRGEAATLARAVVRLLAVGHTSGAALAHGVRAAAELVPPAERPRPQVA
jgi:hypothetical protein